MDDDTGRTSGDADLIGRPAACVAMRFGEDVQQLAIVRVIRYPDRHPLQVALVAPVVYVSATVTVDVAALGVGAGPIDQAVYEC